MDDLMVSWILPLKKKTRKSITHEITEPSNEFLFIQVTLNGTSSAQNIVYNLTSRIPSSITYLRA